MIPMDKDNLDILIEQEKRAFAREHFFEMWDMAIADGVEAEILAEAIVEGALGELIKASGKSRAGVLIKKLEEMNELGMFPAFRTLQ